MRGRVVGPSGATTVRFVLDTGATYTTITPEVAEELGYGERDQLRTTRVQTALGSEHGYVIAVAKISVLGVAARGLAVHIFDLGYDDVDGLIGLNFLSQLNYEIRSAEHRILVEPVARPAA
ncbi:MAG: clan AA aspartic protease [Myxococcales bacterium]|nr:clan AA aspartic protease [Myxococcales bacterium]